MDLQRLRIPDADRSIPRFHPGDEIRVHARVVEGERERIQIFTGLVIRMHNAGVGSTFTVRRVASGVGVERTFPLHSPRVAKIEVARYGRVRRAKLYYLRDRVGRVRIRERERPLGRNEFAVETRPEPEAAPAPEPAAEAKLTGPEAASPAAADAPAEAETTAMDPSAAASDSPEARPG